MYRFSFLVLSIIVIVSIFCFAKTSGHPINFNSSEFYLNLITEVIGITLSVIILEIFGSSILKYLENRKNKEFNKYLSIRLNLIQTRLRQKLTLLNINIDNKYNDINDFVKSIDLEYLNYKEDRAYFQNNDVVTISHARPLLFHNEFDSLLIEIDIISRQLPQGLPNEIYEGLLMLSSHDKYKWDMMSTQVGNYNENWVKIYKELLYDKYIGSRKLISGNKNLKKQIV